MSFGDGNAAVSLETTPKAARLWDMVLKFFFPVLQITSPDHLVNSHIASLIIVLHHTRIVKLIKENTLITALSLLKLYAATCSGFSMGIMYFSIICYH